MAKPGRSGLGRALLKRHNQMINQSKEKTRFINSQQRHTLQSVTEMGDIDAIIEQAEEADRIYSVDHPVPSVIDLSERRDAMPDEEIKQEDEVALIANSLRLPRRPPWNSKMSVEELDYSERQAFLKWRRSLARLEESEKLVFTPFEKNLDIWRQLWRVLERSDLLVMVVDARDPLFYRCPDLEAYALEMDKHKRTLLLLNKADLLPCTVRQRWAMYFSHHDILSVFWSAKAAASVLEDENVSTMKLRQTSESNLSAADMDTRICGRDELLARLQAEAEAIVAKKQTHSSESSQFKQFTVGFVGYPNVGKSSTINSLVGQKRTGVTSTPGKTKHFQTLIVSDKLVLCDCPGLVFPSFSRSRYEMIALGVLPIDRMSHHREVVQVVANKVTRHVLEDVYKINLPNPKACECQNRAPLASELLRAYCSSRGYVGSSGLPDETRAARQILKDYVDGKLPHFEVPPGKSLEGDGSPYLEDDCCILDFVSSMTSDRIPYDQSELGPRPPDELLNELQLFDNASSSSSAAAHKKGPASVVSHKHHKKPQRKKDRSWRVQNDGGDGMPVVRVFQKQPTHSGLVRALS